MPTAFDVLASDHEQVKRPARPPPRPTGPGTPRPAGAGR